MTITARDAIVKRITQLNEQQTKLMKQRSFEEFKLQWMDQFKTDTFDQRLFELSQIIKITKGGYSSSFGYPEEWSKASQRKPVTLEMLKSLDAFLRESTEYFSSKKIDVDLSKPPSELFRLSDKVKIVVSREDYGEVWADSWEISQSGTFGITAIYNAPTLSEVTYGCKYLPRVLKHNWLRPSDEPLWTPG